MKFYLGTNYGHDSASAVMNSEGELLFALEEERINFIKNTDRFPLKSISKITSQYEIECSAEGWNIYKRFLYKGILFCLKYGLKNKYYFKRLKKESYRFIISLFYFKINNRTIKNKYFVGHHLAHAYSLLPWGLKDNSLIMVSDTMGENDSISFYLWNNNKMNLISKSLYPNSIGSIFHQMAYHLGFEGSNGPGKLMAYSSLGKPKWTSEFMKFINIENGKLFIIQEKFPSYIIDNTWLKFANNFCNSQELKEEILKSYKSYEYGKDLASSIQEFFTETSIELILQNIKIVEKKYKIQINQFGISGGSALNCQANYFIAKKLFDYKKIETIVSPWSNDSGTAIGAVSWLVKKNHPNVNIKMSNPYLGVNPSLKNITLNDNESKSENDRISFAVNCLINNGIIALCDNRTEFGPRALGARCILAKADNIDIKNKLNKIKGRELFMPFAPIILDVDKNIFSSTFITENMSIAIPYSIKHGKLFPGIKHYSNLARVQLLKESSPLLLNKVLKEYKKKQGLGLLLLTSLNGNKEPIAIDYNKSLEVAKKLKLNGILSDSKWKKLD